MMAAQPDDGLMPCPFCGGGHAIVDRYDHHDGAGRYRVICADCMALHESGFAAADWDRWSARDHKRWHEGMRHYDGLYDLGGAIARYEGIRDSIVAGARDAGR